MVDFVLVSLFPLHRRARAVAPALSALLVLVAAAGTAHAFGFDDVERRARALASQPYVPPTAKLPNEWLAWDYDQYREIRFRPERSLWRAEKLPFEVQFFHPGFRFDRPVHINEVVGDKVAEVPYSRDQFDYGRTPPGNTSVRFPGFAGFRVQYALNTPRAKDEVLVFLGASYFRALGRGQRYGLSARGLAVDTALQSGEEFPVFTEFWLVRPSADATELTIYALLDSRRVTGAYRFILRPGTDTIVDVRERVFLRAPVTKLGIAPLTSMFLSGSTQPAPATDYRPQVHDSDTLAIQSATGEWIARPLTNPKRLSVSSFALSNPAGFGLQQRERAFNRYEDLDAHYEKRPSLWVQPRVKFEAGRVELVQIPSPDETNDNIVAYWVPATLPGPREPIDHEYRLLWQMDNEMRSPQASVIQTRRGHAYRRGNDNTLDFVVDFAGPALAALAPTARIDPVVTAIANADIVDVSVVRNDETHGARLLLRVRRQDDEKPLELRAFLRNAAGSLTETWSYLLPPG
ncbi:MAG: glucan biosynthesis protein G [Proteobacteria bacterium]|nr:glucan biosynthesis protein G [Pseudomonadota bacterium]